MDTLLRSSESCRICKHSEAYWAVRRWQILNKRELSKASSSILNFVFHLIEVHYFSMNRKETKLKGLSVSRFGSIIFLLRMAGISFQLKKISTIYAIYMKKLILCTSTTYLGMIDDVYAHRDDLGRAMTTVYALIPFTNLMWIFSICR